ncbi:MAG: FmdB family zinc ribbon protein [Rubrobacteraceae bacterium]
MPLYEFLCENCGSFDRHRPLGEANETMPCPECGENARRVYCAPGVISTSADLKKARHLNEHGSEPKLVRREKGKGSASSPGPVRGRPWQIGH